ncbi:MAG TPA: KGG domain-containing protein [Candidatus Saccharimonadales bacterium]|nr:KGG domain-containing protein [Candidatus Saccharimonadales bacterium]
MKPNNISRRGFGSMSPERRKEVSSKGGKASPNNFKNNPEFAREVARKQRRGKKKDQTGI